ncbi:MAG: 50S ribosomal protein L18e [Candidatus Kariarchaeaceae archaeon]|jgi:large subunit ribosomal protein L18e
MLKRKGPTNPLTASLVTQLRIISKENDAGVWRSVSKTLEKPRRGRSVVNISKIARFTSDNDMVVVPGKVLAAGEISHNVVVAAITFSDAARQKIEAAKGRAISIKQLAEENPKGSKVRILR